MELAQLSYLLPRLTGMGKALSRLGGGIGTRGPGETKLETDRRRIRRRISDLRRELEKIKQTRGLQRQHRSSTEVPVVALVGYTNAGKSTLLQALTGSEVFVADQLFATLDPTIRRWDLTEGRWVYLTDTVGFIRKLPHTLVAAFQATLEEVVYADLLLHVIDASHPQSREQKEAVEEVLKEIGAAQPIIAVYNKVDLVDHPLEVRPPDQAVSAKTGYNLDRLTAAVYEFCPAVLRKGIFLPLQRASPGQHPQGPRHDFGRRVHGSRRCDQSGSGCQAGEPPAAFPEVASGRISPALEKTTLLSFLP